MPGPTSGTDTPATTPLERLLARFEETAVTPVDAEELGALHEVSVVIRRVNTRLAGDLEVLALEDRLLIVERTLKGQTVVRRMLDRDETDRFVNDRLATYERMWDGCGCRIDYLR